MAQQSFAKWLEGMQANLGIRLLSLLVTTALVWLLIRLALFFLRRLLMVLDRTVDWVKGTDVPLDKQLESALTPPLRWMIVLLGISSAGMTLDLPTLLGTFIYQVMNSLVAVVIFWAFFRLADVVSYYLRMQKGDYALLDETLISVVSRLLKAGVILFAFVVVMEEWGYNFGALLAGLGVGGLAMGLAAQDALANFISYFMIIGDEPFEVGEYIVADDVVGTVEAIGFRSTHVRNLDQSLIIVPNKTLAMATVTNWSRLSKRRLNMTLSLSRQASPRQILAVVEDIHTLLAAHEKALPKSITVKFTGFGENSLDIMVICIFDIPDWGEFMVAKEKINMQILDILKKYNIGLAYNQAIFLKQSKPSPEDAS